MTLDELLERLQELPLSALSARVAVIGYIGEDDELFDSNVVDIKYESGEVTIEVNQ